MGSTNESMLPDSLVSTEWLAERLGAPGLVVADIRGYVNTTDFGNGRQEAAYLAARDEFDAGHIPGAVFVDWTVDIVDPDAEVKAQIAAPERFALAMEERGIGDDVNVVIVDHSGGHFATRLWWALRFYGHERSAVLDGGWAKWAAEGRPQATAAAPVAPARFTPRRQPKLRVEANDVLNRISDCATVIVDARDPLQYSGAVRRGERGGHVPGAVSIPAKTLVNADGTWRPLDEQRQILADGGIEPGKHVIAYCNGGVTATAVLFALHRTGHQNGANYDGSWNEWGERPDLPVDDDEERVIRS